VSDRRVAGLAVGAAALLLGALVAGGLWWWERDPSRLAERGRQALDAHDLARAEALFRRATAADPSSLEALEGLGWTYLVAGQRDAARASFDRCAQLDPAGAGCLRGQAATAQAGGELGRARELLDQAVALAPQDPKVQSSLGLLELSQGQVEAAVPRFEDLVARFPESAEYRVGLIECRLRQGRHEEALEQVDLALALPSPPLRTRGLLHLLRARVLVALSSSRVDPERCAETAPPVLAWLDAAKAEVEAARATGVRLPTLGEVGRLVGRSRGLVEDACPQRPRVVAPAATSAPEGEAGG
jgi:tetratricopeptide (TPR) repeat protein